jgi:hypothetical protein
MRLDNLVEGEITYHSPAGIKANTALQDSGQYFLDSSGGPDGVRTRDLGLDRAAC